MKTAARRVGVSVAEYGLRRLAHQKWCCACKAWHHVSEFCRSRRRADGYDAVCLASKRGQPRWPRDPAKERARARVKYAVRKGRLPNPNSLACADCGHTGSDRRHEYDHHRGYDKEHWLDVEPVCTLCHADRGKARRLENVAA